MKKLLMKWFPGYFQVSNIINLDQIEVISHPYRLAIVDKDTTKTFDALGLEDDRLEFLLNQVEKEMIGKNCKLEVLNAIEPNIKHINEFYVCVMFLERKTSSGLSGFAKFLLDNMDK